MQDLDETGDKSNVYDRDGRNTSSNDPEMLDARVFIGNLPSEKLTRIEVEKLFTDFGSVLGVSLHKSYGFVQYDNKESAKKSVQAMHGHILQGFTLDVNLAGERQKDRFTKSDGEQSSHHHSSSSRSSSDHHSSRHHSSSSSSRHHHDDHHHSSSRERDRDRERERDRMRERPYRRERSRSPPFLPNELEYRARLRHLERLRGYPPPPPLRDPFMDPLGFPPPRDPLMRPPRDDMYDIGRDNFFPHLPPPGRRRDPYGPPILDQLDRLPPPPHMQRDPLFDRGPRPFSPPPPERRERMDKIVNTDMEVIVVNSQQKEYGELVRDRVECFGLVVDTIHLSPTVSLADALDAAASRGLLYAIIVTSQHEMHRSVTLTILHGRNPQEHKNMPLEDAMGLVARDFELYTIGVREGRIPPRRPVPQKGEVSNLLSQAASGEQLTPNQLQQVIDVLQKKKHIMNEPQPSQQLPPKEDIQRQQADLQAKILSLLGSNAVVPSSSNSQRHGYEGVGGGRGGIAGGKFPPGRGYGGGAGMLGARGDGGGRGYGQGGFGSGY